MGRSVTYGQSLVYFLSVFGQKERGRGGSKRVAEDAQKRRGGRGTNEHLSSSSLKPPSSLVHPSPYLRSLYGKKKKKEFLVSGEMMEGCCLQEGMWRIRAKKRRMTWKEERIYAPLTRIERRKKARLSFLRSINTPQMKMQANLHASVRTVYPGKATLLCRCRRLFFQRSAMTGAQHEGGKEI